MLPSTLSRGKTLPISVDYMLPCMLLGARSRDLLSCRRQAPGGGRREANGGRRVAAAEIMTMVDMIVWTWFSARPPRRDLTMPHGHCVENWSLTFLRKGRKLDLGESRSPTPLVKWNLLPTSHRLCAYVFAFSPGLLVMMAIVMMAMVMMPMVMVSVMAIIVPEALRQVGWLRQR